MTRVRTLLHCSLDINKYSPWVSWAGFFHLQVDLPLGLDADSVPCPDSVLFIRPCPQGGNWDTGHRNQENSASRHHRATVLTLAYEGPHVSSRW